MKSIQLAPQYIKEVLIYAYLWQIPFSWRFIIVPNRASDIGVFNEYMDISLYLGELILVFALIIHIIQYKTELMSRFRDYIQNKEGVIVFHVEHNLAYLFIAGLLLLNVQHSIDLIISVVALFHLLVLALLVYLLHSVYVSRGTSLVYDLLLIFSVSLVSQLCLAIYQVYTSSSVGLRFLNESFLALDMINVAKANYFGSTFLRAYGTFSHPNVLSAFCMFVIVFIYRFRSYLFHVERPIALISLITAITTVLLSQSKLATFSLLVIAYLYMSSNIPRFHVKHLIILAGAIIIAGTLYIYMSGDALVSLNDRVDQMSNQYEYSKFSLLGSGIGTYRLVYDTMITDWWKYEPIHFAPYIVISEIGILLSVLITIYLARAFMIVPRETIAENCFIVLFILYILFTDHYAWDIYQGQYIFIMSLWLYHTIDRNTTSLQKQIL